MSVKTTFVIVLGFMVILGGLIYVAKQVQDARQAACESRGGVYLAGRGGSLCLDPKALR